MKKLLSLLSVLTINGIIVPSVIVSSPNYKQNIPLVTQIQKISQKQEEFIKKMIDFYNNLSIDQKKDVLLKSNEYYKNLSEDKKEYLKQKIKLTNDENKDIIFFGKIIIDPIFISVSPIKSYLYTTEEELVKHYPEHLVKISKVTKKITENALSSVVVEGITKNLKVSLSFLIAIYISYMLKLFIESANPDNIVIDYIPTHDVGDNLNNLNQYFTTYRNNCINTLHIVEKIQHNISKTVFLTIKEIYEFNPTDDMKILAVKSYLINYLRYHFPEEVEIFASAIVKNFSKINDNFLFLIDNDNDVLTIIASKDGNCFEIRQQ